VAFYVLQLLSPVEKACPVLLSYQPCDIYRFLTKYTDYSRRGGSLAAYLCLNAAKLDRRFDSESPPELILLKLKAQLPADELEALRDYFDTNVAMRSKRAGPKILDQRVLRIL
jgi:hypothetical protein